MDHSSDPSLTARLDRLAEIGRGHLARVARRRARAAAWVWAALAALATGAVLLMLALTGAATLWEIVAISLIVPGAAFAWRYARGVSRADTCRTRALALFDGQLGLKDRIAAADEFDHQADPDAFRRAALAEADPWIDRALDSVLEETADSPLSRSALVMGSSGIALMLAALLLQLVGPVAGGSGDEVASSGSRAREAAAAMDAIAAEAKMVRTTSGTRTAADPSRSGGDAALAAAINARVDAAESDLQTQGATRDGNGGMGASTGQNGAGSEATSADPAAQERAEQRQQPAGPEQSVPGAARQAGGAGDPSSQSIRAENGNGANGESTPAGRNQSASTMQGNPGAQRNQENGGTASRQSQSGQGQGSQARNSRSRQGQQGNSQAGRGGNTDNEGGQQNGNESIKRSHGVSGLMLSAPMADQLTGTSNPGPARTVVRETVPQARPGSASRAGDRGGQNGDAGTVPHRPDSAQDRALVRDYFRRSDSR